MSFNKLWEKIGDWLVKHKENKIVYYTAKTILFIIESAESVIGYFERDVYVAVDYISDSKTKNERPYLIRGYVIRKGSAYSFSNIPWEDIDNLIDQLSRENKPINFKVEYGGGWYQNIYLPRWARKRLTEKLIELKEEHK